jgi:hypothetical protein
MARLLLLLVMLIVLLAAMPAEAQAPAPAPAPPTMTPPGGAPQTQLTTETSERNTVFDHIIAFAGMALVLLVVCYPSRRY